MIAWQLDLGSPVDNTLPQIIYICSSLVNTQTVVISCTYEVGIKKVYDCSSTIFLPVGNFIPKALGPLSKIMCHDPFEKSQKLIVFVVYIYSYDIVIK